YLAFFPVAIGALRGLTSPTPVQTELLRCYAASWWQTLLRLRLPASVPYLIPALKLAAAAAVVGAIRRGSTRRSSAPRSWASWRSAASRCSTSRCAATTRPRRRRDDGGGGRA